MKILLGFARACASIFLRSGDENKFLLKSELDVGVFASIFAQIRWFSLKSKLDVVVFLWFLLRSVDFRSNLGLMWWFWAWSGEDPVTQTQTEANRPDRYPPETDPTWAEVIESRRQVIKPFSRFQWVSFSLGTNPTQTDPWTALETISISEMITTSSYI